MPSLTSTKDKGRRWLFGTCEYSEVNRKLTVSGQAVRMESKPLDVLLQLLERPSEVVGKEELLNLVWPEVATTEQSLTTAIAKLRRAFGGSRDDYILNEMGVGYRMAVRVVCLPDDQSGPPALLIQPGSMIPSRPTWIASKSLGREEQSGVWLGQHIKTGESRVYKFAVDGLRLRALQREVAISRLLQQSLGPRAGFAVKILDWSFEEAPFFTESEYCGPDLLAWARTPRFLSMTLEERVELAAQLSDAVALAHGLGVLHNDLKPGNILISTPDTSEDGSQTGGVPGPWTLRVADFGVASLHDRTRLRELEITDHGSFDHQSDDRQSSPVGTPMYRAPEVNAGSPATILADVYALGVLLYQIVCGDFTQSPSPGWESRIPDPLVRQDIADSANVNPDLRLGSASMLAERLHRLTLRRVDAERQAADDEKARQSLAALEAARLRRPWVIGAVAALVLGLCATLWFYRRAALDRDLVNSRNVTLTAMFDFLAQDILGQANPARGTPGSPYAPQLTLENAIEAAMPKIDRRFSSNPAISARLHDTLAESLNSRSLYIEADHEYAVAAERYRQVEGPLSQSAVLSELKREYTELAGQLPGGIKAAQIGFDQQKKLIMQMQRPSLELQVWQASVDAALAALGRSPEKALPTLRDAADRASKAPDLDIQLRIQLQKQFCGLYVRLSDGANLEQAANKLLALQKQHYGLDSPLTAVGEMYLEEALFLQHKYPETIAQADRNYQRFSRLLGPEHQLTLGTLATRAAAEGQIEKYDDAARDDLKLAYADASNPSGARLRAGSLADAGMYECHAGHFADGIRHSREVIETTSSGPAAQSLFANGARFNLAECLIAERDMHPSSHDKGSISQAEALLNGIDVDLVADQAQNPDFPNTVALAHAQIALLRGQPQAAEQYLHTAEGLMSHGDADPYVLKVFAAAKRALEPSSKPKRSIFAAR